MIEEEHSNESQFDNPFDYYEHKSGSMDKMDTTKPEKQKSKKKSKADE